MKVIKKDGTLENYNEQKIINACSLAAQRALIKLYDDDYALICEKVYDIADDGAYFVEEEDDDLIPVQDMHVIVEKVLNENYPEVGECYRQYRNYKVDFVKMLDKVYQESQSIMYIGDKENSNTDSAIVSSKRSLIYNVLNRELYKLFFLTKEELQIINDGYLWIHDMNARRDTMNCCLFDVEKVLTGGFEMGNIFYNEPKTLDVAFDVIGDIVLSAASQQYGGFTLPEIDKVLSPYAQKSYNLYVREFLDNADTLLENVLFSDRNSIDEKELLKFAKEYAIKKVKRDFVQGYQGWEYKFNTVASSRGDYPFITITFGLGTDIWSKMASKSFLKVHRNGQGKDNNKKPVLFPKLVFLYTDSLHGKGKINEDLFEEGIITSSKTMYPDWLSLDGDYNKNHLSEMYHEYGKIVSPMGCRAFLSPWWEKGGIHKFDENDVPVFVGRFNIGAISLNLPMILAKAKHESKDFYSILDYYLEIIRGIHKRTFAYLGEMKASTNPLAYCEGGFYGGNLKPDQKLKESPTLLPSATASFGITAFNELQMLYNGKSLVEDGSFALEVLEYINNKIQDFKKEDGILYAIYGTPAENLCGQQVKQFRKKFGIIQGVSDRNYVSNSFHCHVSEDITPIQKQDLEGRFWNLSAGGRIQYVKYPIDYNIEAIKTLVRRAMNMGFYEGVNLSLAYCEDCGHQELSMDVCPKCGSKNLTKIERMNGYLSYSRVKNQSRLNSAKMDEIADRKSM